MSRLDRDGTWLSYEVEGDGPPVLLIQGVGVAGRGWAPQVAALRERFTCAWFDHRGVGDSGPIPGALSVQDLVGDSLALLDHLGWSSAHVVGHSMGGILAHDLALDHRERVRSLSLLCTFLRGRDAARLTPEIVWLGLRSRIGTRSMRRRAFLELVLAPKELDGVDTDALAARLGEVFGRDLADPPPAATAQLRALSRHDRSDRLAELSGIPTLVLSAAHDRLALAAYGRSLAERIGGARFVELPDHAHAVPVSAPELVDAPLLAHLTSVG